MTVTLPTDEEKRTIGEDDEAITCPYCGEWLEIITAETTFTDRCPVCQKKPVFQIYVEAPLEVNAEDVHIEDENGR